MKKKALRTTIRLVGLSRIVYENIKKTNKSFNLPKFFRDKLVEEFGTSEAKKKLLTLQLNDFQKQRDDLERNIKIIAKELGKLK